MDIKIKILVDIQNVLKTILKLLLKNFYRKVVFNYNIQLSEKKLIILKIDSKMIIYYYKVS